MKIKTILDKKAEDSTFLLTEDQRKEILDSQKEIADGLKISDDDLDIEVQEWLSANQYDLPGNAQPPVQ